MQKKLKATILRLVMFIFFYPNFFTTGFAQEKVKIPYNKDNNTLLWEISGNGLKENSYLFGTMHRICQNDLHFGENFKTALKNSSALYIESYDSNSVTNNDKSVMYMKSGKTLNDICTKDEYNKIKNFFATTLNLYYADSVDRFKPFVFSYFMVEIMAPCHSSLTSMEKEIIQMADQTNKPVYGFETTAATNAFSDIIPYTKQIKGLIKGIDNFSSYKSYNDSLLFMYRNQKLDNLESVFSNPSFSDDEFKEIILHRRSKMWVNKLKDILNHKSIFIAVGAMHLVGEHGVIELLKKEGYTVKPLQN